MNLISPNQGSDYFMNKPKQVGFRICLVNIIYNIIFDSCERYHNFNQKNKHEFSICTEFDISAGMKTCDGQYHKDA